MTRRGLLSMSASLYDPLGFVSPISLIPKLILQTLCTLKLNWDDEIPANTAEKMLHWKSGLNGLSSLKIPRCVKFNNQLADSSVCKTQLHIFSDASEKAYGAAAYIKIYDATNSNITLIMGKSRVAPLKTISIPRLELTAATVAARMYKFITKEFPTKIDKSYFWTDSFIVLKYLQNQSTRFHRFVSHRIQVIQDLTSVSDWHYVPTRFNPADLASRGVQPTETDKINTWLQGPKFLHDMNDYEVIWNSGENKTTDEELEVKQTCFVMEVKSDALLNYFSSYDKMLKAVAWWQKYINYLKLRAKGEDTSSMNKELNVDEITLAENRVIAYVQAQEFEEDLKNIKQGRPVSKSSVLSRCARMILRMFIFGENIP